MMNLAVPDQIGLPAQHIWPVSATIIKGTKTGEQVLGGSMRAQCESASQERDHSPGHSLSLAPEIAFAWELSLSFPNEQQRRSCSSRSTTHSLHSWDPQKKVSRGYSFQGSSEAGLQLPTERDHDHQRCK